MAFGLLGPFEARHDGRPVEVGGRRQERCLLAILLLEAGRMQYVTWALTATRIDTQPREATTRERDDRR